MRRAFVIFLILLFPLNVLALSLSVSSAQADPVALAGPADTPVSDSLFAGMFDIDTTLDLDPDEPPAMDLHDIVNHDTCVQLPALPGGPALRHEARGHCHSTPPPVKPPRA